MDLAEVFPVAILVISGKRKSGKDYVSDILRERFGDDVAVIMRLSGPLKSQYAQEHGLDSERLLDASEYKERYRKDMIGWGEEKRKQDSAFFCKLIVKGAGSEKPVWIVSDARRKTDVEFFNEHYADQVVLLRVTATDDVRRSRGWKFCQGVDDAESECGLDSGVSWDLVIENNGDERELSGTLDALHDTIKRRL